MNFPPFLFRSLLNLWPCIRRTGGRVTWLSKDFRELDVMLPLNWKTRNRVGTIFGGSLYAAVDPFYMIMLMQILGRDFVVWDKAANIRFRKPGQETLYARFRLSKEFTDDLKSRVLNEGEVTFEKEVDFVSATGVVHAEIRKSIYVATKAFYRQKLANRDTRS